MSADPGAGVALIEDEVMPVAEARLPILDWGFLHSDATYDVAHVWQGRFFRLDDHLDRFFAGMEALRMRIPHERDAVRDRLHDLVAASGLREAYVEMICTRGQPQAGSRDPRTCTNRFLAFAVPFVWIADPAKQESGLHLTISRMQRIPPASVDPAVKNYHWLDMVQELFEVFITSTAGGVMPVTRVDDAAIGDGTPGPVTRGLRDAYWDLHEDPRYTQAVNYGRRDGDPRMR